MKEYYMKAKAFKTTMPMKSSMTVKVMQLIQFTQTTSNQLPKS